VNVSGAVTEVGRSVDRRQADPRLRAGAAAFVLAALMTLPFLFSVHPPTDPAHNREFALGANTVSFRLATSLGVYAITPLILGMFALYTVLASGAARGWAIAGLVTTVGGACFLLPGTGYASFVMPAAGVLISQGHEQDVLRLLDQIFKEPGWIPVFLGGIVYYLGLFVIGVTVWRSGRLPRWMGALLVAAAVVGLPGFLDVTNFQLIGAAFFAAALLALAAGLWRLGGEAV
jgi:hypothetical protein